MENNRDQKTPCEERKIDHDIEKIVEELDALKARKQELQEKKKLSAYMNKKDRRVSSVEQVDSTGGQTENTMSCSNYQIIRVKEND